MLKLRKVLFPTDFSECSRRALGYAVKVAREHRSEVHILNASLLHDYDPASSADRVPGLKEIDRAIEDLALREMGKMAREYEAPDLKIEQIHLRGVSAAPAILEYAIEREVDLVVMGTHGRRGVRKLLLGSVATEVMRMAPCSVMTVRGRGGGAGSSAFERILVPVDFSECGEGAVAVACNLASTHGAKLQFLHVLPDPIHPPFYDIGGFGCPDIQPRNIENSRSELRRLTNRLGLPGAVPVEYHALVGNPGAAITQFALDQHSDLIVMATHGLTGIMHFLMGSTTEKVLARAECPVLVVKNAAALLG